MTKIGRSGFVMMLALLPCAAAAQSPPANAPARSFALPPLEELQATRERPLFSPQRRPDAESGAETGTPVVEENPDAVAFELTGVVMGGDTAVAILRNRETQETVHLRQGEALDAWSIEEIAARHVVLRQDDRQVRLELFPVKPDGSPGSQPPSLPPPAIRQNPANLDQPQTRRNSQLTPAQRRAARRGTQPRRPQNLNNPDNNRR